MGYELHITPLDETIEVEEGQTILDAALRAGIYLPHACGQGYCGACKVKVADGEIDHGRASSFALMDYEREEGLALACCAMLEGDSAIEVEIDVDPDARRIPVKDFAGTVTRIETLTPTIRGIWVKLDGAPLDFQAGQYVNINLPNGLGVRAFSLANAPGCDELEFNIRLVPGGAGTAYLHKALQVGDDFTLSGPYGGFFIRKSANKPSLFIAGGSGLSSPRSMIHDLLAQGSGLPITLIHGARNRAELYYQAEFLDLSEKHPEFTYVPVLSDEPRDSAWQGRRGFAHEALKDHFANDFRGWKAYLCGPPPMIEASVSTLMQGRLFEKDIYTEKFFSAADAQQVRSALFRRV